MNSRTHSPLCSSRYPFCFFLSVRIHVNTAVVNSNESVLITYTVLITTILAIISSSTVLLNVIVGPGEHDPTGMLAFET